MGEAWCDASLIALDPLPGDEVDELIERLLETHELPDGARTRIVAAAEGNPLFVEQMLAIQAGGR